MTIVMQGVIHGRTIELEASPGIDDGRAVEVVLNVDQPLRPSEQPVPGQYVTAAGMMANYTEDDDAVLEEIYQDRKRDMLPEIGL